MAAAGIRPPLVMVQLVQLMVQFLVQAVHQEPPRKYPEVSKWPLDSQADTYWDQHWARPVLG